MFDLTAMQTPCLLLDVDKVRRNQARMRAHLDAHGVALRPHLKTCKSMDVARLVMPTPQGPVTVSTLAEAEYFAAQGVKDILYAVGIVPQKLARAAALVRQGVDLRLVTDNVPCARAVAEFAVAQRCPLKVCLEIDCDGHRSGLAPDDNAIFDVAQALQSPYSQMEGVMTHAGGAYNCPDTAAIVRLAAQEVSSVVSVAAALRERGYACPMVSVGSTPTALLGEDFTGVTEVRAGVYMFMDLVMAGLGVCTLDDIALTVLASVIGHQRGKGWAIVDAGWMALSQDRGTAGQKTDQGYGRVLDAQGHALGDVCVIDTNQEHGVIASRSGQTPVDMPVGTLLRILPSHACATAAAFAAYHAFDAQGLNALWPRVNGWG